MHGVLIKFAVGLVYSDIFGQYEPIEIFVNACSAHLARLQFLETVRQYIQVVFGVQIFEQFNSAFYESVFCGDASQSFAAECVGKFLVVYSDNFKRVAVTSFVQFFFRYLAFAIYVPQLKVVWLINGVEMLELFEKTVIMQQVVCFPERLLRGCREVVKGVVEVDEQILVLLHCVFCL